MGIDLILVGRVRSRRPTARDRPEDLLEEMIAIVEAWLGDGADPPAVAQADSSSTLYIQAHPAGTPIELFIDDSGFVRLSATTSAVGPGYHASVCELADALASGMGLEWSADDSDESGEDRATSDETGYFASRDRDALEAAFDAWLRLLAFLTLHARSRDPSDEPSRLCMPCKEQFLCPEDIHTPTGPRSEAWARSVVADPSTPEARSFFAWWQPGQNAAYWLGVAMVELWLYAPPGAPACPKDRLHAHRARTALLAAYQIDPSLAFPWPEWRDLLAAPPPSVPVPWGAHEPEPDAVRRLVATRSGTAPARIGFRRHDIRHELPGGWSLVLPGRFGCEEEEDGTWLASDGRTSVRFSAVTYADLAEDAPDTAAFVGDFKGEDIAAPRWLPDRRAEGLFGRACTGRAHDSSHLSACLSCGTELAFLTIAFDDGPNETTAIAVWRSLERLGSS